MGKNGCKAHAKPLKYLVQAVGWDKVAQVMVGQQTNQPLVAANDRNNLLSRPTAHLGALSHTTSILAERSSVILARCSTATMAVPSSRWAIRFQCAAAPAVSIARNKISGIEFAERPGRNSTNEGRAPGLRRPCDQAWAGDGAHGTGRNQLAVILVRRSLNGNRRADHDSPLPQLIAEGAPRNPQAGSGLRLDAIRVAQRA